MKLLVHIDQKASIAAGCDAPHSTALLEFDPALLSAEARKVVADNIDLATGRVTLHGLWGDGRSCRSCPVIPAPVSMERALAELESDVAKFLRQQAEEAKAKADQAAAAEAKTQHWLATPDAELLVYKTAADLRSTYGTSCLDADGDFCPYNSDATGIRASLQWVPDDTRIALKPDLTSDPGPRREKQLRLIDLARAHNLPIYHAAIAFHQAEQQAMSERAARTQADITTTINTLGSDAQKARLARGLMQDPLQEATTLATDDAFKIIPLDVATPPAPEDIPIPQEVDEPELYDVERDERPAKALNDEEMVAFIGAEKILQTALPTATIQPWLLGITRDHSDIPWQRKLVVRVTLPHALGQLTRDFELP